MSKPLDGNPSNAHRDGDLERLREILVGEKLRSLETGRLALEERIAQNLQCGQAESDRRTTALEGSTRTALSQLEAQLDREREARLAVQDALASLDNRHQQQIDELRQARLRTRRTMTGRSDLARLLHDVAEQLSAAPPDVDPPQPYSAGSQPGRVGECLSHSQIQNLRPTAI